MHLMGTAHSPVPDLLFFGVGGVIGSCVIVLAMLLPPWVGALALGVLSAAAWCFWGSDMFAKWLGHFNIDN